MEDREKYILDLISQGYDICIPGGTGRNGSNAAFDALGVKLPVRNNCEIVVIPIKRKPFEEYLAQQKISRTLPYENPRAIVKREIEEEIKVNINLSKTFLIANKTETDSRDQNKIHRKYLFVSENYDARFI